MFKKITVMKTVIISLQRDTSPGAVLEEQTPVDQPLVEPTRLVPGIDHVAGAGGLLEHTDLVLARAGVVVGHGGRDALERLVALGVVDLEGAVFSLRQFLSYPRDTN